MADKMKCAAQVVSNDKLAEGIYSMWLKFPEDYNAASSAVPGQFISMYCSDGSRLLPRPVSICDINAGERMLRAVYRIAGGGTREFAELAAGDMIDVIAPLGNGFSIEGREAVLIGGGIGIPPLLGLARSICHNGGVKAVLGYRDGNLFLEDEFRQYADVYVAVEDGSKGIKGNVIDALNHHKIQAGIIYACGPLPMLRGVKKFAEEKGIKAQLSLEERMACGIGACLGCVCASGETDAHSNVKNKRVCKDGPVFDSGKVVF